MLFPPTRPSVKMRTRVFLSRTAQPIFFFFQSHPPAGAPPAPLALNSIFLCSFHAGFVRSSVPCVPPCAPNGPDRTATTHPGAPHGAMGGGRGHARDVGARRGAGVLHLAPDHDGGDPQGPRPRGDLHHLHPHGVRAVLQDLDRGVGLFRQGGSFILFNLFFLFWMWYLFFRAWWVCVFVQGRARRRRSLCVYVSTPVGVYRYICGSNCFCFCSINRSRAEMGRTGEERGDASR